MSERHRERMAEFLRQEVSRILLKEIADPRVGFSTITGVDVTEDFALATVHVSFFVPENKRRTALDALNNSAGYIRNKIKPLIRSKRVPTLRFALDEGIEKSARIAQLLRQDKHQPNAPGERIHDDEQGDDRSPDQGSPDV